MDQYILINLISLPLSIYNSGLGKNMDLCYNIEQDFILLKRIEKCFSNTHSLLWTVHPQILKSSGSQCRISEKNLRSLKEINGKKLESSRYFTFQVVHAADWQF